ncbi:hypothetical protein AJ80_05200 [Polytolypa hystricis UAMH7299]|uniref:Uncharacterized protein n=1 Tax=Polytolypa hystricis (strain UAMH7299) TaxID=1447883 RepID=A0A2B7Y5R3_POLH7|nr:hypothetical protein AJ80_05200 [Polytolypa hystricis UAMH7299]
MASSSQQNTNEFPHNYQPDLNGKATHIESNTRNLAVAAAGYANDNHLAGLVEAATAAAGQDVGWSQPEDSEAMMGSHGRALQNHLNSYGGGMHLGDSFADPANTQVPFTGIAQAGGQGGAPDGAARQLPHANQSMTLESSRKRRREDSNVDPAITGTAQQQYGANGNMDAGQPQAGAEVNENGHGLDIRELPPQQTMSDARAAGVHSAVAIFRPATATSKKYTRPPMSKLFASLELSAENFLHLQAAAKAYMLDDDHPERRDCVGQRGKGDSDMVRLRLYHCVRDFLDKEGHGTKYFDEHVINEGMGPRTLIWPRDDQQIITLVTPLLRRMVTNERQRQYAIETRKGGAAEEKKRKQSTGSMTNASSQPARPPTTTNFQAPPPNTDIQLGMAELIDKTYPTDWGSIATVYNNYNQDYRLDNLGSISGLPQQDWWGIIAAVDSHFQTYHHGNAVECDDQCLSCTVNHIVASDSAMNATWRLGSQEDDVTAWNYFATGITRDVSHLIRDNLITRHDLLEEHPYHQQHPQYLQQLHQGQAHLASAQSSPLSEPSPSISPHLSAQTVPVPTVATQQITLHINFVSTSTNKRVAPRLDIPADQCADLQSLLHRIREYFVAQQQQQQHESQQGMALLEPLLPIKVWLEDGLASVQTDAEWMVALLAVSTVDWMDGELRVVVGVEGGNGGGAGANASA